MATDVKLKLVRRQSAPLAFSLSAEQSAVVAHRGSPLTVLGGPGTGKSTTLVQSVISRIREGVDPNSILILAYGRDRAADLRDQIALAAGSTSFEPLARTFHALAFSILNEEIGDGSFRYVLQSGAEQDSMIGEMLKDNPENIHWHPELNAARGTQGFVREVRDLIMRATELGLTPSQLSELGSQLGENYWSGASEFWSNYIFTKNLRSQSVGEPLIKIDSSAILYAAIDLLRNDPTRLRLFRQRYSTILVDEFQESDSSQRELIKLLSGDELILFLDPDLAVGRFRGADPEGALAAATALAPTTMQLTSNFRSSVEIQHLASSIAERFRSNNPARPKACDAQDGGGISFALSQSSAANADQIAYALRQAHLHRGIPWSKMAVILRNPGSEVTSLIRALTRNGIPLRSGIDAVPLAESAALAPILLLAELAIKGNNLTIHDWPLIEELLISEFGGADSLALKSLRVELAKVRDDQRSTNQMMIDTLLSGIPDLEWERAPYLQRTHQLLEAARKSLRTEKSITHLLWTIWDGATNSAGQKIADAWRDRAIKGGARGAAADRDLDAVIQLFNSAERFAERNTHASPQQFLEQITSERILADSISASGSREEVLSLLTVHSAKGLEFDFVVVTGLQEGLWPNLTERGSLLGSERLVEHLRSGLSSPDELRAATRAGLIEDERRLLYVALSRSRKGLFIAAYESEDSAPSRYFDELIEAHLGEGAQVGHSKAERSLTLNSLVAHLRYRVQEGDTESASILNSLKALNIPGADPDTWVGVRELSTTKPVIDEGKQIRISPSSLEPLEECQLKWFLERSGAKDADSEAQLLGVAIHYIAAKVKADPGYSAADGAAELIAAWPVVNQSVGWVKKSQLERAQAMLTKFFEWNSKNTRTLVDVEQDFTVQLGRITLSGSADRIEINPQTGKYFIIDLKTGAKVATKKEAISNLQLKSYQLAIIDGGFEEIPDGAESEGAGLLFVAKKTDVNESINQPPLVRDEFVAHLTGVADVVSGPTFKARINSRCRSCQVKVLCPLQSKGGAISDE